MTFTLGFFLCSIIALAAWSLSVSSKKSQRRRLQWEQEQRRRDIARCQAIEEGLQAWLTTLELPQFEDRTKLQAAAHQLRIVLVEQLMHGPRVR